MRLLDLFCGAGGAAVGYHRAGFDDIVGVDINPQPNYPFRFIQADAIKFLDAMLDGREDIAYDLIHASPPCQAYSTQGRSSRWGTPPTSPPLIKPTQNGLDLTGRPFVIENVAGARSELREPMIALRGPDVGLMSIARLRYFELGGWMMLNEPIRRPTDSLVLGIYGRAPDGRRLSAGRPKEHLRAPISIEEAAEAMDMDWCTEWREIAEAIPPAYTHYIGERFLEQL